MKKVPYMIIHPGDETFFNLTFHSMKLLPLQFF